MLPHRNKGINQQQEKCHKVHKLTSLLNQNWMKEEIKKVISIFLELNENANLRPKPMGHSDSSLKISICITMCPQKNT